MFVGLYVVVAIEGINTLSSTRHHCADEALSRVGIRGVDQGLLRML
jgi:hypothetical protein